MLDDLSKEELLDVVNAYDRYIQNANGSNYYESGWFPVCIEEFYNCDYQNGFYTGAEEELEIYDRSGKYLWQ